MQGEGDTRQFADPLSGDLALPELAQLIAETMPADSPEQCVGSEAKQVAHYIYATFYSPLAQARNAPARVRLSRLTVRQYENAIADLTRSFTAPGPLGKKANLEADRQGPHGLQGDYFNAHQFRANQHAFQRRDATILFDFGITRPTAPELTESEAQASPARAPTKPKTDAEKKPKESLTSFSVRWQGSLFAPATGLYQFILETPNGSKLWLNDNRVPLIDAWVASGDINRHHATIRLLGGRFYPVRIDLFKHKEKKASIRLKWLPPNQSEQVIPERLLSPVKVTPTLVVRTPFPPDDQSTGYVRANRISQAWDEATTYAGLEVATRMLQRLSAYVALPEDLAARGTRLRQFCTTFAQRAFRRPLSPQENQFFIDRLLQGPHQNERDLQRAVKETLLLVLKSPRFLYREARIGPLEGGEIFTAYDTAAWLSFTLWDSLPDAILLEAAAAGELETRAQVTGQAVRMVNDRRAKAKLHDFLEQWLKLDQPVEIVKDSQEYPRFSKELAADLRTSLELLLDQVVESEAFDFRQLLLTDSLYANGRMARFYGVDLPADAPFQPVADRSGQRVGLLSHPYLLARYAYTSTSSPIHRGVMIARSLLGRRLMPPPIAVEPLPPQSHVGLSTRERVALQTRPPLCQTCHRLINPLGFTLENFDTVGRFRDNELGLPVDTAGSYVTNSGEKYQFWSVPELAAFLASSKDAHEAFIQGLFQFMINQPIRAFGDDTLTTLERSFVENECSIQALLAEIATTSAWRIRTMERQRESVRKQGVQTTASTD